MKKARVKECFFYVSPLGYVPRGREGGRSEGFEGE